MHTFHAGSLLIERQHHENESLLALTNPNNMLLLHKVDMDRKKGLRDIEENLKLSEMALNGTAP